MRHLTYLFLSAFAAAFWGGITLHFLGTVAAGIVTAFVFVTGIFTFSLLNSAAVADGRQA
jgi:hypothetical protein